MKAKRKYTYDPDYAVPPGETIREHMEFNGWTQQELAIRLETTQQTINRIFKGEQPITLETANRLELVFGSPARFWNNLELNYREQLSKLEEKQRLASDLEWLKTIPTSELISRKVIPQNSDKHALLCDTLKFYGVSSVRAWCELWERPEVAARRSQCFESLPGPASSWIRMGELQAQKCDCRPYDRSALLKQIHALRSLSCKADPSAMVAEMRRICAECGVALALVKEMKKAPWNGATRWLTPTKAMILLNLRGKGEDKLWFSFFHELGHVLHDSKKDLMINDGSKDDPREKQADEFAAETLIPARYNGRIKVSQIESEIKTIANELGVSPGIVAGRYQFLTHKWSRFNTLIRKFAWNDKAKDEE